MHDCTKCVLRRECTNNVVMDINEWISIAMYRLAINEHALVSVLRENEDGVLEPTENGDVEDYIFDERMTYAPCIERHEMQFHLPTIRA